MELFLLDMCKSAAELSDAIFRPLMIAFCAFLAWRIGRVESRIAAKLDNGLMCKIIETHALAVSTNTKLIDLKVSEDKCQKRREEFEDKQTEKIIEFGQKIFALEEHERMA